MYWRLTAVLFFWGQLGFASSSQANLVVIYSYPPGEWYHGIQSTLEEVLKTNGVEVELKPIIYHSEYWTRQSLDRLEAEKKRILEKVSQLKPKAVILCDDEASDVFAKDLNARAMPLFILGINKALEEIPWWDSIKSNAALVLEEYPVSHLLSNARRVFPKATRIQLVTSKNLSSDIIVRKISEQIQTANSDFSEKPFTVLDPFISDDWQKWKAFLAGLKSDLVWILVPYDVRDEQRVEVSIERMARWLEKNLKIPSLGLSTVHPKMGVLLTVTISPQQMAKSTALQIASWWKGKPIHSLSIRQEKQGQLQVNRTTLERFKVVLPKEILSVAQFIENPNLPYGR